MNARLTHIGITLAKELRETLRDRRTLAMMVLFPLVVYPLLSLLVSQLVLTREKKREEVPSRVALSGSGPAADDLRRRLSEHPKLFQLVPGASADVEAGRLDAVIVLNDGATAGAPPHVEIFFDAARDESREAEDRLADLLAGALPDRCTRF